MNRSKWIFTDGEWQMADEPLLTARSRAVSYGDGCFETFRSYSGRFFRFEAHHQRLHRAMDYLHISPHPGLEEQSLKKTIGKLLDKNDRMDTDSVVRIQVWREGERGFGIPEKASSHYVVSVSPLPVIPESLKLATVPTRRIPAEALNPGFKLSNAINYIRAATEAARLGADDALMLTVGGFVSETTIANIFWVKGDTIFTPSPTCDILPGITREILIEIIQKELDVMLEEGEFSLEDLLESETVWVCNSVREMVPVNSVDDRDFATSHPFYNQLLLSFKSYITKTLA